MKSDERASGASGAPQIDGPRRKTGGGGRKLPSGLVALGSAAVLTIYSAGYFRTKEAAARFAEDASSGPGTGPRRAQGPAELKLASDTVRQTVRAEKTSEATGRRPAQKADVPAPVTATPTIVPPKLKASSAPPFAPPFAPPVAPVIAPPVAPVSTTPSPTPVDPIPKTNASSTAADPAAADTVSMRKWNDGTYTGWGTSRHGDIEATVVVRNGAIASASISQCLTRYSCSWISALPGQVIARQSPEVDYVSGATQSTNAFYYAVVQALSRAR